MECSLRNGVLQEIAIESWHGPFDEALRRTAREALESGKILYFPRLPFRLEENETEFLSDEVASGKSKNISLDPATGTLQGMSVSGESQGRLAAMIDRFGASATSLVQ